MTNIQQIEVAPIAGNAFSDSGLMDAINRFVLCKGNSICEKIRALRKLDQVMGIDTAVTEEDVREYIEESQ